MDLILVCQDCDEQFSQEDIDNLDEGDVLECQSCGAEHEVVEKDPVRIVLIEEEK